MVVMMNAIKGSRQLPASGCAIAAAAYPLSSLITLLSHKTEQQPLREVGHLMNYELGIIRENTSDTPTLEPLPERTCSGRQPLIPTTDALACGAHGPQGIGTELVRWSMLEPRKSQT